MKRVSDLMIGGLLLLTVVLAVLLNSAEGRIDRLETQFSCTHRVTDDTVYHVDVAESGCTTRPTTQAVSADCVAEAAYTHPHRNKMRELQNAIRLCTP